MQMPTQHMNSVADINLPKHYNPRPQDVIFKNGCFLHSNSGNQQLCMMIIENCSQYHNCSQHHEKGKIIYNIMSQILHVEPQGIFVERSSTGKDYWKMMTVKEVYLKIESTMRQTCDPSYSLENSKLNDSDAIHLRAVANLLEKQRAILRELLDDSSDDESETADSDEQTPRSKHNS